MNKKAVFWGISIICFAVYGYFYINFLGLREFNITFLQVLPLFICVFLSLVVYILFSKYLNFMDWLVFALIHSAFGIYSLLQWFEPRSEFLLENQQWLTYIHSLWMVHICMVTMSFATLLKDRRSKKVDTPTSAAQG